MKIIKSIGGVLLAGILVFMYLCFWIGIPVLIIAFGIVLALKIIG
jgi:hypothetical protein